MSTKRTPREGLTYLSTVTIPATQMDILAERIAEAVAPAIDAVVKAAIADFLSRVQVTRAAGTHNGHDTPQHRSLAELLALPNGSLVTPHEASMLTGLSIENMKTRRRFHSFPLSVKAGHRSIAWKMGDIRKFLKQQAEETTT